MLTFVSLLARRLPKTSIKRVFLPLAANMLTKQAKERNKNKPHFTFSDSSSWSHRCTGEIHTHTGRYRSQTSQKEYSTEPMCRVTVFLTGLIYNKVSREQFSHLPVERAEVEVRILFDRLEGEMLFDSCREGKNTQNTRVLHLILKTNVSYRLQDENTATYSDCSI